MGRPRLLAVTGTATVLLYLAMIPSFHGMSGHGASLGTFEDARSVAESTRIVTEWGDAGRDAARTQLHHTQPWPLVSADTAIVTRGLAEGVLVFAVVAGASTLIGRPRPAES